jgi:hypothetical protein
MFNETTNMGIIQMSKSDTNVRNPLITVIEEKFDEFFKKNNTNGKKQLLTENGK